MGSTRAKNGKTGREMADQRKWKPLLKRLDALGVPKRTPKEHVKDPSLSFGWDPEAGEISEERLLQGDAKEHARQCAAMGAAGATLEATKSSDGTTSVSMYLAEMPLQDQV